MSQVSLLARFTAKEGKGDEIVAAFQPIIDQVRNKPGALLYLMNRAKDDPNVFWFAELYADDAAFAAHGASEAMAKAMVDGMPEAAKSTPDGKRFLKVSGLLLSEPHIDPKSLGQITAPTLADSCAPAASPSNGLRMESRIRVANAPTSRASATCVSNRAGGPPPVSHRASPRRPSPTSTASRGARSAWTCARATRRCSRR